MQAAFRHANGDECLSRSELELLPLPKVNLKCINKIPHGRGLGSSAAAVVAGILTGTVLTGRTLSVSEADVFFNLACNIEGHPDNVGPALYGGLQVGVYGCMSPLEDPKWINSRVPLTGDLQCVVFVPDFQLDTSESRRVLPKVVSVADAVHNSGRAALLIAALSTGQLNLLSVAMQDKLHQPYRQALNVHLTPVIDAAIAAGGCGACLAGAGPSVFAWISGAHGEMLVHEKKNGISVGLAMKAAASASGVTGRIFIARPSMHGAFVQSSVPQLLPDGIFRF